MLRSSISIGRFLGIDLRIHASIPLLFAISVAFAVGMGEPAIRGVGLWVALCLAIVVREVARAIAAAYVGLRLRAVFLLPVGGVMAFAPRERGHHAGQPGSRAVTNTGPIANFFVGLLLLGTAYALDPHVSLLAQPWIGTSHILRSFIWMQFILGAISLLPASAMPTRQLLRMGGQKDATTTVPTRNNAGPSFGFGTFAALAMIVAGFLMMNLWFVILGGFVLLGAQISGGQALNSPEAESITVNEVMLTEYTLLSTTDTLRDALSRTVHSMQDVFPVVRGNRLVGSIARQTIADSLLSGGDSYLQGIMSRALQTAEPHEKIVEALRRAAALGASEFIPVVEDGAMLGILTPQSLQRAVSQIQLTRAPVAPQEQP